MWSTSSTRESLVGPIPNRLTIVVPQPPPPPGKPATLLERHTCNRPDELSLARWLRVTRNGNVKPTD